MRRTSAAVATFTLVFAGFAGTAEAQGARPRAAVVGTKATPAVEDCGLSKPSVRPATLTLACADANDLGVKLVWVKWTQTTAYATGSDTWNTCVPYCAASKTWDKAKANFTLSDPVHTPAGWLYEKLVVHVTGNVGKGMAKTLVLSEKPLPK